MASERDRELPTASEPLTALQKWALARCLVAQGAEPAGGLGADLCRLVVEERRDDVSSRLGAAALGQLGHLRSTKPRPRASSHSLRNTASGIRN